MRKLEDILSEEKFSAEQFQHEKDVNTEDIHVVKQLYSFLQVPKNNITPSERGKLKVRIENSVKKVNRRRNNLRWLSIASVLIFSVWGGVWYFQLSRTSDIVNFANALKENKNDSTTRLVLNTGHEILIQTKDAEIKYDKKGEKINIDSNRKIQQKIEPLQPSFNTIYVPYGKRAQITLSEGTKVWLNSGSKLVYPAVFASDKREVYIDGEGIFEVTKNSENPFIVKSSSFDIRVTGTVFNVSAYSDDKYSYTVLESGTIQLEHPTKTFNQKENRVLFPGDMAILNPDGGDFTVQKVDPMDYLSWRDGYYVFRNERLDNILKKLSRYYNVEILLENKQLLGETFSGSLDLKTTPEEVLNVIKKTNILNYRKEDGEKIIIF